MIIINNTQLKIVLFIEECWSNILVHMWEWYAETLVKVSENMDSKGCSGVLATGYCVALIVIMEAYPWKFVIFKGDS